MKNVKIALSIMLSVLMAFAFGVDSSRVQARDKDKEVDIEEMFKIQEEACLANEAIYASFDWDETFVYPDDFAGNYIDYDTLHVQVTSEEAIENYKPLLEGYDCVCYDVVEHSYNELYKLAESVVDSLPDRKAFVEYYVDIKDNKAVVCILKDYKEITKEYLPTDERLETIYASGYVIEETSVIAGSEISSSGQYLTLGGSGTYESNTSFLTSGHNLTSGSAVSYNGSVIGYISVRNYYDYCSGDYAIISASSGYTATSAVYNSANANSTSTTYYGGYLLNPTVGTSLYKYGKASYLASCQISQVGVTINSGSYTIYGLTKATLTSGSSAGGDSGGPYRFGLYFCGIHHGVDLDNSNIVFFTPYAYPYYAGFRIKTN